MLEISEKFVELTWNDPHLLSPPVQQSTGSVKAGSRQRSPTNTTLIPVAGGLVGNKRSYSTTTCLLSCYLRGE